MVHELEEVPKKRNITNYSLFLRGQDEPLLSFPFDENADINIKMKGSLLLDVLNLHGLQARLKCLKDPDGGCLGKRCLGSDCGWNIHLIDAKALLSICQEVVTNPNPTAQLLMERDKDIQRLISKLIEPLRKAPLGGTNIIILRNDMEITYVCPRENLDGKMISRGEAEQKIENGEWNEQLKKMFPKSFS